MEVVGCIVVCAQLTKKNTDLYVALIKNNVKQNNINYSFCLTVAPYVTKEKLVHFFFNMSACTNIFNTGHIY